MNKLTFKNHYILAGASFLVLALVLIFAPRSSQPDVKADVANCSNAPLVATLNPYGLTSPGEVAGTNCHDYPLVSVRNVNASDYSYQADDNGQVGDEFYIRLYVHNGAATNPELAGQTLAQNVSGQFSLSGGVILASASGSNTNQISGSAAIQIPSGAHLEIVQGSQVVADYQGGSASGYVNFSDQGGSFSFGDMQACFDKSRFIRFKVRVVGPAVAQPSGDISASLGGQVSGQCLYTANVNWNTQNADPVEVRVSQDGGSDYSTVMARATNGSAQPNWITPGYSYTFNLYISGNTNSPYRSATVSAPALNAPECNTNPTPVDQTGSINFNLGAQVSGQCLYNGTVTWSSQNVDGASVTADDLDDNQGASEISTAASGSHPTPWLTPGHRYVFILTNTGTGGHKELARTQAITIPSLNCGPVPTPPPAAQISCVLSYGPTTYNVGDTVQFLAQVTPSGSDTGVYTWSAPGNSGGSYPSARALNVTYNTSGTKNVTVSQGNLTASCPTIFVNQPNVPTPTPTPTSTVCPSGSVSLSPSVINQGESATASAPYGWYGGRFVSQNTNVVTVSGNTVTATYTSIGSTTVTGEGWTASNGASNCPLGPSGITVQRPSSNACVQRQFSSVSGIYDSPYGGNRVTAMQPGQQFYIKCNYGVQSAYITLLGTGAQSCTYSNWDGQSGVFRCTAPSAAGTYTAACVLSNNQTADNSCQSTDTLGSYTVSQPAQNLSCTASKISAGINESVVFTANGGNGSYNFTGDVGNPSTALTSNPLVTSYTSAGSKYVTVNSGGQTASCPVVVINQPVQTLTCTPSNQNVAINQSAGFTANGGNGSYSWSAPGSNNSIGYGQSFNTSYGAAGYNTVTVTSGGQTANCAVNVQQPQPQQLICQTLTPSVNVGQTATFSVSGGNGSYSWSAPASSNQSGNGSSFNTAYSTSGGKSVTVTSGSQTASCSVQVNEVASQDVFCNPGNQNANLNQTVYFTATGGNGSYSWSAFGSANQSGNGSNFNTAYSVAGGKIVTVTSGSKSAICNVQVLQNQPQTLTCSPSFQNVDINQTAYFNALGGTAPYTWTASGAVNQTGSGSSFNTAYTTSGTRSVNLHSSDGQSVNCNVTVNQPVPTPTPTQTGNCNNSDASCNNNTNNNNQTSTGNNSANQNNQSNINGNNNTVTQTNNNCVNNSCNNYYYIQGGNTVPANDFRNLSIEKTVRNVTNNQYQYGNQGFQNSVTANSGDTVEFQIVVRNTGNQPVSNIVLTDQLPSGLSWLSGQFNGTMNIGTLYTNDTRTVTFQARVNTYNTGSQSIQNIAYVRGDSVSQIQDDAWVFAGGQVQGGSVNLTYSKRAVNETKTTSAGNPIDATSVNASREDYITYTLTVTNTGNTPANSFVITDDLSQVLPYADIVDNGGGSLNGNVITFPGITVPANGSVSKSFKVRVKYSLASNLTYTMSNTYGNTLNIRINNPQVLGAFVAPKTGADTLGVTFALLLTGAFVAFKKRELLSRVILNS